MWNECPQGILTLTQNNCIPLQTNKLTHTNYFVWKYYKWFHHRHLQYTSMRVFANNSSLNVSVCVYVLVFKMSLVLQKFSFNLEHLTAKNTFTALNKLFKLEIFMCWKGMGKSCSSEIKSNSLTGARLYTRMC